MIDVIEQFAAYPEGALADHGKKAIKDALKAYGDVALLERALAAAKGAGLMVIEMAINRRLSQLLTGSCAFCDRTDVPMAGGLLKTHRAPGEQGACPGSAEPPMWAAHPGANPGLDEAAPESAKPPEMPEPLVAEAAPVEELSGETNSDDLPWPAVDVDGDGLDLSGDGGAVEPEVPDLLGWAEASVDAAPDEVSPQFDDADVDGDGGPEATVSILEIAVTASHFGPDVNVPIVARTSPIVGEEMTQIAEMGEAIQTPGAIVPDGLEVEVTYALTPRQEDILNRALVDQHAWRHARRELDVDHPADQTKPLEDDTPLLCALHAKEQDRPRPRASITGEIEGLLAKLVAGERLRTRKKAWKEIPDELYCAECGVRIVVLRRAVDNVEQVAAHLNPDGELCPRSLSVIEERPIPKPDRTPAWVCAAIERFKDGAPRIMGVFTTVGTRPKPGNDDTFFAELAYASMDTAIEAVDAAERQVPDWLMGADFSGPAAPPLFIDATSPTNIAQIALGVAIRKAGGSVTVSSRDLGGDGDIITMVRDPFGDDCTFTVSDPTPGQPMTRTVPDVAPPVDSVRDLSPPPEIVELAATIRPDCFEHRVGYQRGRIMTFKEAHEAGVSEVIMLADAGPHSARLAKGDVPEAGAHFPMDGTEPHAEAWVLELVRPDYPPRRFPSERGMMNIPADITPGQAEAFLARLGEEWKVRAAKMVIDAIEEDQARGDAEIGQEDFTKHQLEALREDTDRRRAAAVHIISQEIGRSSSNHEPVENAARRAVKVIQELKAVSDQASTAYKDGMTEALGRLALTAQNMGLLDPMCIDPDELLLEGLLQELCEARADNEDAITAEVTELGDGKIALVGSVSRERARAIGKGPGLFCAARVVIEGGEG